MGQRFTVTGTWTIEVDDEMAVKEAGFMSRRRDPLAHLLPVEEETLLTALSSIFQFAASGVAGLRVVEADLSVDGPPTPASAAPSSD